MMLQHLQLSTDVQQWSSSLLQHSILSCVVSVNGKSMFSRRGLISCSLKKKTWNTEDRQFSHDFLLIFVGLCQVGTMKWPNGHTGVICAYQAICAHAFIRFYKWAKGIFSVFLDIYTQRGSFLKEKNNQICEAELKKTEFKWVLIQVWIYAIVKSFYAWSDCFAFVCGFKHFARP